MLSFFFLSFAFLKTFFFHFPYEKERAFERVLLLTCLISLSLMLLFSFILIFLFPQLTLSLYLFISFFISYFLFLFFLPFLFELFLVFLSLFKLFLFYLGTSIYTRPNWTQQTALSSVKIEITLFRILSNLLVKNLRNFFLYTQKSLILVKSCLHNCLLS